MQLDILPLAIAMMIGPQILASIIFVTSRKGAVKVSLGYLLGIALAIASGITIVFIAARLLGISADASGHAAKKPLAIELGLVGLLILLSLRSFLKRKTAKPPKWLSKLQSTKPAGAFKLGVLLIFLMPTDLIITITVGLHLAAHGSDPTNLLSAVPFLALTMLVAGFPLLAYLLFRHQAEVVMPKIRNWMSRDSWLVNIIIYLFFIYLVVT